MIANTLGLSLKLFLLTAQKIMIGVFLKVHLTSAENRTKSAFVPHCRGCFIEIQRSFREQDIYQLAFKRRQNNTHYTPPSWEVWTARSTSSERVLLVCRLAAKVHLYREGKVLPSVCLSVPCLRVTRGRKCNRNFYKFIGYST